MSKSAHQIAVRVFNRFASILAICGSVCCFAVPALAQNITTPIDAVSGTGLSGTGQASTFSYIEGNGADGSSTQAPPVTPAGPAAEGPPNPLPIAAISAASQVPEAKPPAPDRISTKAIWSQFIDVPISGSAASTVRYGGKFDAYIGVKGSLIGLDDSVTFNIHPEFKYGKSSNGKIGLLPANTQLFYPGDGDVFDLSINVTKRWKSGTSLTLGKINILDLAAQIPVQGGGGHEGFQNHALALPPSAIVPGSLTGALLDVPTEKLLYRLVVFDSALQSRRSGFETPFAKGVGMLASATLPTKIGGKPGYYTVKIAASTRSEITADALPPALVPAPGSPFGHRRGEVAVVLAFDQYLTVDPKHRGNGIGIFGQIYFSNGDPSFLDASGFIGIAGNPKARPQDRFGLSYFRYSLTNGLVNTLSRRLALQDEEGVEVFYTFGIKKNLRLTANLQVVDSAISARDVGITTGLRLTALF